MHGVTESDMTQQLNNNCCFIGKDGNNAVQMVKNLPVIACDAGDLGSIPGSLGGKIGLPTPIFLPGEFHGQRSLVGCSLWGHKESDTTEQLTLPFHFCLTYLLQRLRKSII